MRRLTKYKKSISNGSMSKQYSSFNFTYVPSNTQQGFTLPKQIFDNNKQADSWNYVIKMKQVLDGDLEWNLYIESTLWDRVKSSVWFPNMRNLASYNSVMGINPLASESRIEFKFKIQYPPTVQIIFSNNGTSTATLEQSILHSSWWKTGYDGYNSSGIKMIGTNIELGVGRSCFYDGIFISICKLSPSTEIDNCYYKVVFYAANGGIVLSMKFKVTNYNYWPDIGKAPFAIRENITQGYSNISLNRYFEGFYYSKIESSYSDFINHFPGRGDFDTSTWLLDST